MLMRLKKLLYPLLLWFYLTAILPSWAQTSTLYKGRVLDNGGEVLVGAQIKWKDTSQGTVTNVNGEFILPGHKENTTLVVSYIGYKTIEFPVKEGGASDIIIQMKDDAQNLDELVVVGYGIQKKSSITGSVETIKAEDLLMMPTTNLDQALTSQVAGLQVMQSTGDPSTAKESELHIRGINSAPLLVIDGVPRFGTNTTDGEMRLSDLNPDDIESVTILKDAAAAAVYGVRAANGVILVQTKRAVSSQKTKFSYRGQYNLQEATHLPEFLNAYEFALLRNRAIENSASTATPYTESQLEQIRTQSNPNVYANENMLNYLEKTGWSTTHSVSANGGNDFIRYYLSFGYADTKGLYSGVGRQRLNHMAKIEATLAKGLVLSVNINGSRTKAKNSSYTTVDAAYSYSPVQVLRFSNGLLASAEGGNPLINIKGLGGYRQDKYKMSSIIANLNWEIPWIKGLSAYIRGTFDDNNQLRKTFSKPVTLYTYDELTDSYSPDVNTMYPSAQVSLTQYDQLYESQLYETGLNYDRTFDEKHNVGATLVANYQRTFSNYMQGENKDKGILPETMGTALSDMSLTGNESKTQRASMIGRFNYGYGHKLFFEFSFRLDGSNNFAPKNRWGFFPSISGAWVISNEDFFKKWNQKVLSNLKLRASTGWLGNDGLVGAYSYLKTYLEAPGQGYQIGGSYRPGLIMNSNPNPELTWGKTHDYNFGIDLGFWDGRIGVTYEYFIRYETNKITSAPEYLYPYSTGVNGNVPSLNFSKLKAWGWDLTINHRNTIGKFKYNIGLTLAKSDDEYLDFGDESSQNKNLRRKGRSSMVWTMYEADGLFQNLEEIANWADQDGQGNASIAPGDIKYVDQNDDKKIDVNDMIYVKNSSYPDLDLGLRVGASYKGFFFNTIFQGEYGFNKNIPDYYSLENGTLQRFQKYHLTDTWTENNPNAQYPRIKFASSSDNNRKTSTFWVRNCSFIRLKMLNIGYQFPQSILKNSFISTASIALQGSNLFTISDLTDMDPEQTSRGYPIQRSYGITLNLGF